MKKIRFLLYRRQSGSSCGGFEHGCQHHPCMGTPAQDSTGMERRETDEHPLPRPLGRGTLRILHNPGEGQTPIGLGPAMVAVGVGVCAYEQRPLRAQDSAHYQPWWGGRCLGEALSPKDGAPQQAGCGARKRGRAGAHKRSRGQGGGWGMRERTGQQGLTVRPKSKEGPRRPSISELERITNWGVCGVTSKITALGPQLRA